MLSISYLRKYHPRVVFLGATIALLILTILILRSSYIKPIPRAFQPPDLEALPSPYSKTQADEYTEPTSSSQISIKPTEISNGGIDHDGKNITSQPVSAPVFTTVPEAKTPSGSDGNVEWFFNTTRDERNYRLTAEQCGTAFPGLFSEIERAVAYRRAKGDITLSDVDTSWKKDGVVRALIIDQQVCGPKICI